MGNVSLWINSVILLCLSGITFSHRFPYENPSSGYRNVPSKLNLRNFLGSKLIQRLADNQNNAPQYEPYPHQMSNPLPCEQMGHPPSLPPQPLPSPPTPSYSRGMPPYEYQNQRMPVQSAPQSMGSPRHFMSPPPSHVMDHPPSHAMDQPPHPPSQQVSQSNMQENIYTETVTSSCPECEAANQDYPCQEEPCSCCEGGCPCSCEECSCCSKGRGRCPCYPDDSSYPSEKDYPDRDQNYDDYPASDCPCCCCDCAGNHECPCSYPDEPQAPPPPRRERPSYRGYSPMKPTNENYMDGPDSHVQHESYQNMGGVSYKSIPPVREVQHRRYQQYDESVEPPQCMKMSPRRTFVPQSDIPPPVRHHAPISEFPEESMHRHHRHHMAEPAERAMQHPHMSEMPDEPIHHAEMSERVVHRYHEPAPPMPKQPLNSCPMHQEGSRVSEWRPVRMPPPAPPRHIVEEENLHPEPPVPMYRNYQPISNRYGRKYRQPSKPPFFEGLSYTDGC